MHQEYEVITSAWPFLARFFSRKHKDIKVEKIKKEARQFLYSHYPIKNPRTRIWQEIELSDSRDLTSKFTGIRDSLGVFNLEARAYRLICGTDNDGLYKHHSTEEL